MSDVGPTYNEDLVLYAGVSEGALHGLQQGQNMSKEATGRTWIAFRETWQNAVDRSTWLADGAGNLPNSVLTVRFTALGVSNLVRARVLVPAPVAGSWRFYADLPPVMVDAEGELLLQCQFAAASTQ